MDPLQLVGLVAVIGGLGYAAAAQHYSSKIRKLQQRTMGASLESTSRFAQAAIDTLVTDYGHDKAEATAKLFKRCAEQGMTILRVDPKTGDSTPVQE